MNILKNIPLFFLIAIFTLHSEMTFSQPNQTGEETQRVYIKKHDSVNVITPKKLEQNSAASKSEAEFYKLMYENEKNSSSKFITLSQWTLGGALTILLGILGLQTLFNYRINNAKINEIKSDINQRFFELSTKTIQDIESKTNEIKQNLEDSKKEISNNISGDIDSYLTQLSDAYEQDFEQLKKESKEDLSRFTDSMNKLEIAKELHEAEISTIKGWHEIAFSHYVNAALLQNVATFDSTRFTIPKILDSLNKVSEINKRDFDNLNKLFAEDESIDKEKKREIENKLKAVSIYFFPFLSFLSGNMKKEYVQKATLTQR